MFLFWLWQILRDERGQDNPEPEPEPTPEPEPQPEPEPEPEPKPPKYGDFGDNPTVDQLYEAITKQKTDFDNFRKKSGLTEQNLGQLRQTLETAGIVVSEDGKLRLRDDATRPKTRFTNEHRKLYDPKVLESMQFLMEDMLDKRLTGFQQNLTAQQQWDKTLNSSIDTMYRLYPSLQKETGGKANPSFNQAFFDRANELLNDPVMGYQKVAQGDLFAAQQAAIEMGISPVAVEKAKVEGYRKGIEGKRVLGPAKPSGGKPAAAVGRLSKADYLKLSPEDKEKYDRETMDQK